MALSPGALVSTRNDLPPIAVFYGLAGSGKTALAAQFPDPYYLPTMGEEPPTDVEMATPGYAESLDDIYAVIGYLLQEPHEYKTFVIDSLDGVEPLVWKATCEKNGWTNIEDAGFGKGYVAAADEWRELISGLQALRASGIAVVLLAHEEITRFDDPSSDPYSRYGIKLHKRASALVQEAAQIVGFIKYRHAVREKDVGFNKKVGHAEGSGEREIHVEERPGFLAKNRYSMPPKLPYKKGHGYAELSKFFPEPRGVVAA